MSDETRYVADCRKFPSENDCSLTISGTKDEVLKVSLWHAVEDHGHEDTPAFRKELENFLEEEK